MELFAPAKINLSFRILGKRADGFHEIETLMAPISLADRLTISKKEGAGERIEFSCDDPTLPTGPDNLVVRAAELFLRVTKTSERVALHLEKKIPHGAGLGGGSSDAASVLLGLNELFATGLQEMQLLELAAQIGSDVPFFILRSAANCSGRGEIVRPARMSALRLLLLKPEFGVPTPWAYSRWQDSRELPEVNYAAQNFSGLDFTNDLERPVFEKFVFLAQLKMWLLAQTEVGAALMSGSGSTVFAVLREAADAQKLADRARQELDLKLWTCACETAG